MKKTLRVHKDESLAYLIDRVENTKENDIYLDIDDNLELFSEIRNLKLLKRESDVLGKTLTMVSEDQGMLSFLENAGFDVLERNDEVESDAKQINVSVSKEDKDEPLISDIKKPSFLEDESESKTYKKIDLDVSKNKDEPENPENSEEYVYGSDMDRDAESFFEKTIKETRKSEPSIFNKKRESTEDGEGFKWSGFNFSSFGKNKKVTTYGAAILVVLIIGGIFFFKSKATLDIVIKKETINFTFPVSADVGLSGIDFENSKIPGQIIKLERETSGEFKATGASSGATKATGKLTIYNNYSSDSQPLIAKTRFQTKDGKIFRISKRVIVPGAKMDGKKVVSPGVLEVEVTADQPGADYNIGSSDFTIPGFKGTNKFDGFSAKSSTNMTGGSFGETRAVSKSDLDNAKSSLLKQLQEGRKDYIASNVPNNLVVLDSGINENVIEFKAPKEGTSVDNFTASVKVLYNVFAFDEKDVVKLSDQNLVKRIKKERKTYPDTLTISYEEGILNLDKSSFDFLVRSSEVVGGKVDEANLKSKLAGKGELEIKKVLTGNDAIESAEITLWPFWSSKAPSNPNRINIKIEE